MILNSQLIDFRKYLQYYQFRTSKKLNEEKSFNYKQTKNNTN